MFTENVPERTGIKHVIVWENNSNQKRCSSNFGWYSDVSLLVCLVAGVLVQIQVTRTQTRFVAKNQTK